MSTINEPLPYFKVTLSLFRLVWFIKIMVIELSGVQFGQKSYA